MCGCVRGRRGAGPPAGCDSASQRTPRDPLPPVGFQVDFIDLIAAHGYGIVLAVAFVDQFGTPIPSIAILLAAGAVAGQGQLGIAGVLATAWAGTIAGDVVLYEAGRWRGGPVMRR